MEKYVVIPIIKLQNNNFIPIWDNKIKFIENYHLGNSIDIEGEKIFEIEEGIFNLTTKEITTGISLDYYYSPKYKVGDIIYFEVFNKKISEEVIKDIEFEQSTASVIKGTYIDEFYRTHFKDIKFKNDLLYILKTYDPVYIFESGKSTKWEHKIYSKI